MKIHSQKLPVLVQSVAAFIIILSALFSCYVYVSTKDLEVLFILIPSMLILVVFIGIFFVVYQSISISEDGIDIRYFPIFRKKILFKEIENVRIINNFSPFKDACGIGFRRAPGKIVCANTPGIAVEVIANEVSYVYSFGKSEEKANKFINEIKN